MTDWRKLDAALAAVLGSGRGPLTVFVHYDRGGAKELRRIGVHPDASGVATATLPAADIEELSERPWVRQIRLSSPLRLLDDQ